LTDNVLLDKNNIILQKPAINIIVQALTWNPQGKRKRGCPRNSWQRDLEKDIQDVGFNSSELGEVPRTQLGSMEENHQ